MSDFYQDMQAIATDLLTEFNQGKIEYVARIGGNGPADDPGLPQDLPFPVMGVARGVQHRYIDNTNIVTTDLQVTISTAIENPSVPYDPDILWDSLTAWGSETIKPDMRAFMRIDGRRYKIIGVKQIPPAGTPVAYVVIFRK